MQRQLSRTRRVVGGLPSSSASRSRDNRRSPRLAAAERCRPRAPQPAFQRHGGTIGIAECPSCAAVAGSRRETT
jgi:hypothetical protein